MKTLRAVFMRMAGIFGRRRRERQFAAEMESNLQMHIEDNMRAGMSRDEARRQALLKFGGANTARDSYERQSGLPFLETLLQDLRYAGRMLRNNPGFTMVAVLTLALGIGANTAIFSVINAVLLRPLPYRNPDRLVQLWETEASPGSYPFAPKDFFDWQEQNHTLEGASIYSWAEPFNASSSGEAKAVAVISTQANFFRVLGAEPLLGRTFVDGEDHTGKNHVAVLTYGFWQRAFGGRSDVLNQTLTLDNQPYTVIGVMPPSFNFSSRADLYSALAIDGKEMQKRGTHSYLAIGRMKPGVTAEAAEADLAAIARRLEQQFPDSNDKVGARVISLREQLTAYSRPQLLILLGAVALVLLVACANVANLLLARATGRRREMALRTVLGASRARVIRQLLTESVLLALLGAAFGLAAAWWTVSIIQSAKWLPIPRSNPVQVDLTVLFFTVLVSVFVGVLFGLAPALQAGSLEPGEELKANAQSVLAPGGWQKWLRNALVVAEMSISLALLVGAGLLLRSFANLRTSDIGIQTKNVVTASFILPEKEYATAAERTAFCNRLLERMQQTPGIEASSITSEIPLEGGSNGYIKVEGDTNPAHKTQLVEQIYITPDYFRVFQIPLLEGRTFTDADLFHAGETTQKIDEFSQQHPDAKSLPFATESPVIISRSLAQMFWPNQDPVGKVFKSDTTSMRIIGVVGDVSVWDMRQKQIPAAYFPIAWRLQWYLGFSANLVVRSPLPPTTVIDGIRKGMAGIDPALAVFGAHTMNEVLSTTIQDAGLQSYLLGSFAGLALLLSAIGLYSVLAYLVTQRTREIGIRMALGAQRLHVVRMVMTQGAGLTLAGLAIGVAGSLALTRVMSSLLYGVTARDPGIFALVAALLLVVAMLACYIPARRAMKVEPMVALREE
jgi:putative ABC transport system permease protein